ncbi:MAG: hypothetical protein MK082_05415 [Phycisphaerales bacterium]|nr:hypothetical protein [Phycisphaerales bacterium]
MSRGNIDMDEIRTYLRKGQRTKYLVLTVLCAVSAVYGAWQYWFRIPERDRTYVEYMTAVEQVAALEETSRKKQEIGIKLSEEEVAAYNAAEQILSQYADDKPQRPSKYDGLISLVVWFIGGASGIPFLVWPIWKYRNGGWILDQDGSIRTPKGDTIPGDQITGIDMSTWRGLINPQASNKSTWQAKLELKDKRTLVLDDYPWDGMSRIIGHFAHHFHPSTWDENGEPIEEGITRASEALTSKETANGTSGQAEQEAEDSA